MRAIILAAGYGTRMYPLTTDLPKPLLPVGPSDQCVLHYTFAQLSRLSPITATYIVTNHRFAPDFEAWLSGQRWTLTPHLLDDGTTSARDRLGAVSDLALVLHKIGSEEHALVLGADNIFELSMNELLTAFSTHQASTIAVLREPHPERLRRTGVVQLGPDGRVVSFEEKPARPRSPLMSPPLYALDAESLTSVETYLADGHCPDAIGSFIAWLSSRRPVYGQLLEGTRWDIGSPDTYQEAREHFRRS